ncbi:hypothetical protein PFISCL1PPCAC_12843, partial [Pristionchus fissidentatus]
ESLTSHTLHRLQIARKIWQTLQSIGSQSGRIGKGDRHSPYPYPFFRLSKNTLEVDGRLEKLWSMNGEGSINCRLDASSPGVSACVVGGVVWLDDSSLLTALLITLENRSK